MGFEQLAALRDQLAEQAKQERRAKAEAAGSKQPSGSGRPARNERKGSRTEGDQSDRADSTAGRAAKGHSGEARSGTPSGKSRPADAPGGERRGPRAAGEARRAQGGSGNDRKPQGGPGRDRAAQGAPGKDRGASAGAGRPRAADVDPVVVSISRLQRAYPKAFPKKPEPKVPLKLGVHEALQAEADTLGLSKEDITEAIKTWCQGSRYWACLIENAPRLDLNGEPVGVVTAVEAKRARQLAHRQRVGSGRRKKTGESATEKATDVTAAEGAVADAPVADVRVPGASVTDASVTDASVADAPVADAPVADAPVADASGADASTAGAPDSVAQGAHAAAAGGQGAAVPASDGPAAGNLDAPSSAKSEDSPAQGNDKTA